jgi:hypothetical protein
LAIAVRAYAVSGNFVVFYFDQARDAILSRSIYEQGDLRILGPSASGTGDVFYHGVLFYYLIGLLYVLFVGEPMLVSMVLGVIHSLGVIFLYLLGREVFKSRSVGLIAATFYAVNTYSVSFGTWLSNPFSAPMTIAGMYYCLWQGVFEKRYSYLIGAALFLGLTNQAALFTVYLLPTALLMLVGLLWKTGWKNYPWREVLIGGGVYLITTSTMVVGTLMLWSRGIGNDAKGNQLLGSIDWQNFWSTVWTTYTFASEQSFFPGLGKWVAVIILLGTAWAIFWRKGLKQRLWGGIFLFAPLILLLLMPRKDTHTLAGVTNLFYLAMGIAVVRVTEIKSWGKIFAGILVCGYVGLQVFSLMVVRETKSHPLVVQRGAVLSDQIAAIEYIYDSANGAPISFSTLTNPYATNTTWAYLFSWYGVKNYGYAPKFLGNDQVGMYGADLLERVTAPVTKHYSILEPLDGIPMNVQEVFEGEQRGYVGEVKSIEKFGDLMVQKRIRD